MDETNRREYIFKIMSSFSDNAKTYTNISIAALMLPITFLRQIIGVPETMPIGKLVHPFMIWSWVFFLCAIACGLFYQYLAIKFIEARVENRNNVNWFVSKPGYVYGTMMITFYLGAIFFTLGAGAMYHISL